METRHSAATKRKGKGSEEQESHPQKPAKRSRTLPAQPAPASYNSEHTGPSNRSAGRAQSKQAGAARPATRRTAGKAEPAEVGPQGEARTEGRRARDGSAESQKPVEEKPGHLRAKRQPPTQHKEVGSKEAEKAGSCVSRGAKAPAATSKEQHHVEPSGTGCGLRRRIARGEGQASAVEQVQQAAAAASKPSPLRARGSGKAAKSSEAATRIGEAPSEGERAAGAQDAAAGEGSKPGTEKPGERDIQRGMAGRNAGRDTNEEVRVW
jgi:hypothetical protein